MISVLTLFIQSLDVDLAASSKGIEHLYPAPLTGHELMALFPPALPAMLEKKPAYTSSLFRQEERAFFSQDKIVRPRKEIDLPWESDRNDGYKTDHREPLVNQNGSCSQMVLPSQAPTPRPDSQHCSAVIPILPSSFQRSPTKPPQPSYQHGQHMTLVNAAPPNTEIEYHVEGLTQDSPGEAWQRPMPYVERRRAGKHTKHIIIGT